MPGIPSAADQADGVLAISENVGHCASCAKMTNTIRKAGRGDCRALLCSSRCADRVPVMVQPHPRSLQADPPAPPYPHGSAFRGSIRQYDSIALEHLRRTKSRRA